jgi:murein L,D-transpeptidase YcbB/YkuD
MPESSLIIFSIFLLGRVAMKFNKKSTVTSCLVLCLSAALMVGCKPIFEKKPLPPKDDAAAAAPAPAAAPVAAPAPAEPAKIEDVQSLESLDSEAVAAEEAAAPEPVADDGDDVVKPTSAMMRDIQQALVDAGFNPGPVDGKSGAKTVSAIDAFQKQNGLPAGKIDKRTLRALGVAF